MATRKPANAAKKTDRFAISRSIEMLSSNWSCWVKGFSIDKGLVDNRHLQRTGSVRVLYVAAVPQGDSQGVKKGGSHKIDSHRCKRTIGQRIAPIHQYAVFVAPSAADAHLHNCRGVHTRQ